MNLFVQLINGELFMRKSAIACVIFVDDGPSSVTGYKHPLSYIKFSSCECVRFLQDIRIAHISLNDFIFVFFSVFKLAPHVVRINAELAESLDDGYACASGAGNRLYDPKRSLFFVGLVIL